MREIHINPDGGPVEMTLTVGDAHFARYRFTLWGSGGSSEPAGDGNNIDGVPDIFFHNPRDCAGKVLGIEINIAAYKDTPDQDYSARIDCKQQGAHVDGSPLSYSGKLDGGVKAIVDYARITGNQG
jgi:hypothetical protein